MKFYNIKDESKFFNRLSKCEGGIEIVAKDGAHITLLDEKQRENLGLMAATYADGTIKEIELFFLRPVDAFLMASYIA